jgi:predicted metalloprotease with PDZ domain
MPRLCPSAVATLLLAVAIPLQAQSDVSAPVSDIEYAVRFDRSSAEAGTLHIDMRFRTSGTDPVLLSLPAWTPGAYEISNFARKVLDFGVTSEDRPVRWDKLDYDTWRIHANGRQSLVVSFDYRADSLDNAMSWSQSDFVMFNGTNVFLYPEGSGFDFPARVTFATEQNWKVASGLTADGQGGFWAENYHELVDMPVFIGNMDVDSAEVDGVWNRLATYPAGAMLGEGRTMLWDQIRKIVPPMHDVFDETPWATYTTLLIFTDEVPGGSALEHSNSHVGIYNPGFIGNELLASITAHEIFHAWNVKRLRPAEMVPYDYSRPQATTLLWVSEGITDYYADLALVRGGVLPPQTFYQMTARKMDEVGSTRVVALEDASLNTWIDPVDGTRYIYYSKGSLSGLLLDIMIRDASNNLASLDDVMRTLYQSTLENDRGFTTDDFWAAVDEVAIGLDLDEFHRRYIDGRDAFPYARTLAKAGLRFSADSAIVPKFGLGMVEDSAGIKIVEVTPESIAGEAGVEEDDYLLEIAGLDVMAPSFAQQFQQRLGVAPDGTELELTVLRDGKRLTLPAVLRYGKVVTHHITEDPTASPKALRIREGILTGR